MMNSTQQPCTPIQMNPKQKIFFIIKFSILDAILLIGFVVLMNLYPDQIGTVAIIFLVPFFLINLFLAFTIQTWSDFLIVFEEQTMKVRTAKQRRPKTIIQYSNITNIKPNLSLSKKSLTISVNEPGKGMKKVEVSLDKATEESVQTGLDFLRNQLSHQ